MVRLVNLINPERVLQGEGEERNRERNRETNRETNRERRDREEIETERE